MRRRSSALRPAFIDRHHFQSSDHVPVAALRIVAKLSDRIPRRKTLDAPLFRRDMLVARYDERSGVRGHGTPKRCIYPPIRTAGLGSTVFDTLGGARRAFSEGSFFCPAAIGKQPLRHRDTVDLPLTLVGIALFSSEEGHCFVIFDILRTIYDVDYFAPRTNGLTHTNVLGNFFEGAVRRIPITPDFNPNLVVRHRTSFRSCGLPSLRLLLHLARGVYVLPGTLNKLAKHWFICFE